MGGGKGRKTHCASGNPYAGFLLMGLVRRIPSYILLGCKGEWKRMAEVQFNFQAWCPHSRFVQFCVMWFRFAQMNVPGWIFRIPRMILGKLSISIVDHIQELTYEKIWMYKSSDKESVVKARVDLLDAGFLFGWNNSLMHLKNQPLYYPQSNDPSLWFCPHNANVYVSCLMASIQLALSALELACIK